MKPVRVLVFILAFIILGASTLALARRVEREQGAETVQFDGAEEYKVATPGPRDRNDDPERGMCEKHACKLNELLVRFVPSASDADKVDALGKVGATLHKRIKQYDNDDGELVVAKLTGPPEFATLKHKATKLKEDAAVDIVEYNYFYEHQATPNDNLFASQWDMQATGGGCNAVTAWNTRTNCGGAVVGVIDTGVCVSMPDLQPNVWVNTKEVINLARKAPKVDDDRNGYVDDKHGWDFFFNDSTVYDSYNADSHGCHTSGTIGAAGNNGGGVAGLCWSGVQIVAAKFLGPKGGSTDNAIAAMRYIYNLKVNQNYPVVATSNSWGGGGYSDLLKKEIKKHALANILFIAAAGNDGANTDNTPVFPAGYAIIPDNDKSENVMSIGAIERSELTDGAIAGYSNYGSKSVHIFAPGSNIWSLYGCERTSCYVAALSGTSMATPHVTGAAALYAAEYNSKCGGWPTYQQVKSAILTTGRTVSYLAPLSISGKLLDVGNLLASLGGGCPK